MTKWQPDGERSKKQVRRLRFGLAPGAKRSMLALAMVMLGAGLLYGNAKADDPVFNAYAVLEDISDTTTEANADLFSKFGVEHDPWPTLHYDVQVSFTPPEWGVAQGEDVPIGAFVGTLDAVSSVGMLGQNPCGTITLTPHFDLMNCTLDKSETVDYNGQFVNKETVADGCTKWPAFLDTLFPGMTPIARMGDYIRYMGGTNISMNFLIFPPGTSLPARFNAPSFPAEKGYVAISILNDPTGPLVINQVTDLCPPLESNTHYWGLTKDNPRTGEDESGNVWRTNPDSPGTYTFWGYTASIRDADGDNFDNALDVCPTVPNGQCDPTNTAFPGDTDKDGLCDACDPTPNVANWDPDGDTYLNFQDNCPLVANGKALDDQHDSDLDRIGDACDGPDWNGDTTPDNTVLHAGVPDGQRAEQWFPTDIEITGFCPPVFPGTYTGSVTIDGSPAPNGTVISATVEGIVWSSDATSGGNYAMTIPESMPVTPPCFEGGWITFYADGLVCAPAVEFAPGLHQGVNLVCGGASIVRVDQGISIEALSVPAPGVGAFTINATYNPNALTPLECSVDPAFDLGICNPGAGPSTIRATGIKAECGLSGDVPLATIPFEPTAPVCPDDLVVSIETFASCEGGDMPVIVDDKWWVGDADRDFDVDAVDALFILQYVVGMRDGSDQCPPPPGSIYLPAADADCDGDVDAVDALFVLQHVVGLRPVLCPAG